MMALKALLACGYFANAAVVVQPANQFDVRRTDWRFGAVVYQVYVDRFVPPKNIDAKRNLYPSGSLHAWSEEPQPSQYDENIQGYPHTFQFWGGDLAGVRTKLDFVKSLGVDVLYLTPIFLSPSNHKYDTTDYFQIDPQLGDQKELAQLIGEVHKNGMRIMLDGVFNHIGLSSPLFQDALTNPASPRRDWWFFGPQYELGYRTWSGVKSMPGWQLETPAARDYLWNSNDSVVKHYLRSGIDGWRLDVAYELGPQYLYELTEAAHSAKRGAWVVGEVSGYPSDWFPALDGVFNFTYCSLAMEMLNGRVTGGAYGRAMSDLVADSGVENLLKSWILTDNHDTERLATKVPDLAKRQIIHMLQLTLPGSPCLYYGSELGMKGTGDPNSRAPMRWDLAIDSNPEYVWVKKLLSIRRRVESLRIGNYRSLATNELFAFVRTTDRAKDTAVIAVNPTDHFVNEVVPLRVGRLMSWGTLKDEITGTKTVSKTGLVDFSLAPGQMVILTPYVEKHEGYGFMNRIP